ncbi:MAG: hypothetical protein ACRD2L_10005, partial [Terriglobia bacterium]
MCQDRVGSVERFGERKSPTGSGPLRRTAVWCELAGPENEIVHAGSHWLSFLFVRGMVGRRVSRMCEVYL